MLPLDLLRYRIQGDEVSARYVNPKNKKYRAIARDLIEIYAAHLNKTKGSLASALADYEAADTNYHITRGLAKLLEDRSEIQSNPQLSQRYFEKKSSPTQVNAIQLLLKEISYTGRHARRC